MLFDVLNKKHESLLAIFGAFGERSQQMAKISWCAQNVSSPLDEKSDGCTSPCIPTFAGKILASGYTNSYLFVGHVAINLN